MKRQTAPRQIALTALAMAAALAAPPAFAQGGSEEDLAKQLANLVASLISVPFQFNWGHNIGPARDGRKFHLNFQPVTPVKISDDWNLVARTIVPIVDQHVSFLGDGSQSGIGTSHRACSLCRDRPPRESFGAWGR